MQRHHAQHQHPTRLRIRSTDHGPKIPDQESHAHREPHGDEDPIQHRNRTPTDQRNRDPNHIRIAIQRPTLGQTGALPSPEPAQNGPQGHGHDARVAIHEPSRAAQQAEIVHEARAMTAGQILRHGARDEQDEDDRRRDPKGPVQIRVAVQHVEEGEPRVERRHAASQHFGRVDVEVLRVEGERPEEALRGRRAGSRRVGERVRAVVAGGGGFGARVAGVGEVWGWRVRGLGRGDLRKGKGGGGGGGVGYWRSGIRGLLGGRCGRDRPGFGVRGGRRGLVGVRRTSASTSTTTS